MLASGVAWSGALVSVAARSSRASSSDEHHRHTASPVPPYEQIRARLAELIVLGILAPETPLPSVRQLATTLDSHRDGAACYTELRNEGWWARVLASEW